MHRDPAEPRTSAAHRVIHAALFLVAAALLSHVLWDNRHLLRQVLSRRPDPLPYLFALSTFLVALVASFGRWYLLVRILDLPFRFVDALRLGFIGNVFNLIFPGSVGGDVVKAGYVWREQRDKTAAVASVVLDRAVGMLALFALAGGVGILAWPGAPPPARRLILVIAALGLTGLVAGGLLFVPRVARPVLDRLPRRGRIGLLVAELRTTAAAYRDRPGGVLLVLAFSIVIHVLLVLAFFSVSRALFPAGAPSFLAHLLVVPLVVASTAVPLPFGALGLSEQVSAELFELVGHPGGAVVMLGYRLLLYAGGLLSLAVYAGHSSQARSMVRQGEAALHSVAPPD